MSTEPDFVKPVELLVSMAERITFASHQNDVAVVADLVVRNNTSEAIEDLRLSIECEPPLFSGKTWNIDRLAPESEVRIRDRALPLAGALLSEINERVRSQVTFKLKKGDEVLLDTTRDLLGLARNEWGGASYMPELLAAFVMPNDPAVSTLLKEAGEVLRSAGENCSIDGYQSKQRKRVWQIVSAIWSAISSRRLIYASPPASFESEGQKVRTPSDILESGLATCLDTALLFAAVVEQAGLNPIIALSKGHAFCGVWLQPQNLPTLTFDDCVDLRKCLTLNELVFFETTLVTSEPALSFSKATKVGERLISESEESNFVYALDIKRARSQRITPLNSFSKFSAKQEGDTEQAFHQALESAPELPCFDIGVGTDSPPDSPETRLEHWKRKLLDLTKRNRLLDLKPSKTAIKLNCPDPAKLEDRLADGQKITVTPMVDLASGGVSGRDAELYHNRTGEDLARKFALDALERNEVVSEISQKDLDSGLVELFRKAKTDIEEGGANTLFLALGILKWKQSPNETRVHRAPLVLVPVKLERRSAASKVKIAHHEDDTVFNMTLLEMLRQDFNLRIPELEGPLPQDQSGIDVSRIYEIVRRAVRDVPGFEVVEETVLSTFSFSKFLMWKDLAQRTELLRKSPFVNHLIERPDTAYSSSASFVRADEIDQKVDSSELYMPLQADSSQVVAVHASAQEAGDFVLEGPPGTGKSQTIANIIAHNLGLGRRVLFVAEKMAALEVVYRRLREKGLGDFCLELHSNKANKREVLNQLERSWKSRQLKTRAEWKAEVSKLTQVRDELNDVVRALHSPGETGISPRTAIGRAVRWSEQHRVRLEWKGGLEADRARDSDGLQTLFEICRQLGLSRQQIASSEISALSLIRQTDWSKAWESRVVELSKKLRISIGALERAIDAAASQIGLFGPSSDLNLIRRIAEFCKCLPLASKFDLRFSLDADGATILALCEDGLDLLERYHIKKAELSIDYADPLIESVQIEHHSNQLLRANASNWITRSFLRWACSRKIRSDFALSSHPNLDKDLPVLGELKALRKRLDEIAAKLPKSIDWLGVETDRQKLSLVIEAGKQLRRAVTQLATSPEEFRARLTQASLLCVDGRELLQDGMPNANAAMSVIERLDEFEILFSEYQSEIRADGDPNIDLREFRQRCSQVVELQPRINSWCRWQAAKERAEQAGLSSIVSGLESGAFSPSETEEVFRTAYCVWLADRLVDSRTELRTFSALEHEEKVKRFRALDKSVAELSVDCIRATLSGDIPPEDDKNRPAGYSVLQREIQKKIKHKPVRQLINEIGDVLTTLTPCLLMSPLSVAQFLSADTALFDLVIFDEASQITVWDAIGAVARGKNVIVVGDPKQMPPTNFFDRAASENEDEGPGGDDLESILDEALASGVKLHRLTGHYRSRHESLIAFSNHRYYSGDLVTFPSVDTKSSSVSMRKVSSGYQRGAGRTNPKEAQAVVEEIVKRLGDSRLSKFSIGVVTLNSEQQRLISDLLDQERRKNPDLERFFSDDSPEPLIVKNLETVQGDQRDVIMLSIGYGPDTPDAKTMPMSFGPLNRKGGERRLNVAITRATSEVIVFSSFDPSMIDLTRTSAQAVRDLKRYLEFAQRGPSALGEAILSIGGDDQYDSEFEQSVAEALRRKGWRVQTQVGVSKFRIDLGIIDPNQPGRYLAGIECDGAAYHSSPSARDRDRVRHSVLENLGWKLIRIWSTSYFIDPQRTIEQVHGELERLLEASTSGPRLLDDQLEVMHDGVSPTDESSFTPGIGASEEKTPRDRIN